MTTLYERLKALMSPKSVQMCVPPKGTVAIVVSRSDNGKPITGATTTLAGPSPGGGSTDDLGASIFTGRTPGGYTANVTLPGSLSAFRITQESRNGSVAAHGTLILPWKASPIGHLCIEVYDDDSKAVTEQAQLSASGPAALTQAVKNGTHTFADVPSGLYKVSAGVPAARYEEASVSAEGVQVPVGGTARKRLIVKRLFNIATPKIEVEYKVVLLDRKLSLHQLASETKIVTDDVTYIEVSASQTTRTPLYAGGATFEVSPANVEVYLDKSCTRKLAGRKLTNAEIGSMPLKLYLKSKTKGKFTAKLTLDPSTDPQIEIKPPATEEMGVVELEATLHRFDKGDLDGLQVDPANDPVATYHTNLKAKDLPAQKALSDTQKVKEGRLLHVQDGKHHGRARLIVKKLAADQWPGGTDDYEITLSNGGGALTLFDKEEEGAEKAPPHKIKVKDLKAKEIELWVQGKAESDKLLDAVLDLGLDRQPGGLAKEAKANGDWGRFTVVKIDKVELVASVPGGKPKVWDAAKKRYYVNTEAGEAGRTLGDKAGQREVKVVATLSKEIAHVPLHFMLAPEAANAAPAGMPATWKAQELKLDMRKLDCTDRKALMHFSQETDAKGKAEIKTLVLSAFGGDKFTPAAYIQQDPHLAKYVKGHDELGKRVPKVCADTLQVWKHFHYKIVYMKRHDGASYSDRFTEASLQAKFEADFIEMESSAAAVEAAHKDYVPYETARDWVTAQLGADQTRVIKLAFVDGIGKAAESDKELTYNGISALSFDETVKADEPIDLSARAKWLKSAKAGTSGAMHDIPAGKVTLVNDGVDYKLSVDLSGMASVNALALPTIKVKIFLLRHEGPSGLSWGPATLVSMRYRESGYPGQEEVATKRTAYHEIGHYLGLAPKTLPDTAASPSTLWYNSPGVGNHCKFGPQDCTLWHSFIMKIEFCPTCKLAMRARDHSSQVGAATPF